MESGCFQQQSSQRLELGDAKSLYRSDSLTSMTQPKIRSLSESGTCSVSRDSSSPASAEPQPSSAGGLQRQILEAEGEILCLSEIIWMAADVLVLRGSDGERQRESPLTRSSSVVTPRASDVPRQLELCILGAKLLGDLDPALVPAAQPSPELLTQGLE